MHKTGTFTDDLSFKARLSVMPKGGTVGKKAS